MKTSIRPNVHTYIYNLLILIPMIAMTVASIYFSFTTGGIGIIICAVMFGAFSIALGGVILYEIQWVRLTDEGLSSRNIFGVVRRIQYDKIKRVLIVDAIAFTSRGGIRKTVPTIVVSSVKSIRPSSLYYAVNHKKDKYVILPYSKENLITLKAAYREATGKELEID